MSTRSVSGVISTVNQKPWKDSRSGAEIFLHSFQLEGSNQWFRTGQNPLPVGKGTNVKFTADGPNVDLTTLQVTESTVAQAPSVPPQPQAASGTTRVPSRGRASGGKDEYWENKEARDLEKDARYRAVSEPRMAMSVAIQAAAPIVVAALQQDALSLGNVTKAKKLGIIIEYTKELANDLARHIHDAPEILSSGTVSVASSTDAE